MKNKKKEKITYIDDARTIADMSDVRGGMQWTKHGTTSSVREILRTYFSAVRMMLLPTLIAVGFIIVAFIIVSIIFWIM